jgi:hypothetical protein
MNVNELITKCSKFYWSPDHPSTYVLTNPQNKKPCGIGLVAHQDWAAFNLTWAANKGVWDTFAAQHSLVTGFQKYKEYTGLPMDKLELRDWVCMLTPEQLHTKLSTEEGITSMHVAEAMVNLLEGYVNDLRRV